MGKGSGSGSHKRFKDKAKNRVDDLQGMFTDLQLARKESRAGDVVVLEEQVQQLLREWKAELNEISSSTATSLLGNDKIQIPSDLSSEIIRLLQLGEEEDDATSKLVDLPPANDLKPEPFDAPEPEVHTAQLSPEPAFQQGYFIRPVPTEQEFLGAVQYKNAPPMNFHPSFVDCLEGTAHLNYVQFSAHQESMNNVYLDICSEIQNATCGTHLSDVFQAICPPPSAFLRPKCALWDCSRPACGSDDYCSNFHSGLALNESPPGRCPVLRPGGIDLKDGPLFAALCAKTQGKNVGIPECEGAATTKSPWNAPELFDLSVLEGETLREWLFFDKPRRAFESGNRKQRSLPDYNGRGWHESRKQVLKEFGGLKRSYYMDPQPLSHIEWHLFEYEINNYDICALYRLELKIVDPKKITSRGKLTTTNDPVAHLQQQMGRLNAEQPVDIKRNTKSRAKVKQKFFSENVFPDPRVVNNDEDEKRQNPGPLQSPEYSYDPGIAAYSYTTTNNKNLNSYFPT